MVNFIKELLQGFQVIIAFSLGVEVFVEGLDGCCYIQLSVCILMTGSPFSIISVCISLRVVLLRGPCFIISWMSLKPMLLALVACLIFYLASSSARSYSIFMHPPLGSPLLLGCRGTPQSAVNVVQVFSGSTGVTHGSLWVPWQLLQVNSGVPAPGTPR